MNEDIVVPRGKLVELVEFGAQLGRDYDVPVACFGHAGDGNIHVNLMVKNPDDPATKERMERALDALFRGVLAMGGTITGNTGSAWPRSVGGMRQWRPARTSYTGGSSVPSIRVICSIRGNSSKRPAPGAAAGMEIGARLRGE